MRSLVLALALTTFAASHAEAAGRQGTPSAGSRAKRTPRSGQRRAVKRDLRPAAPSASPTVIKAGRVITVRRPLGRRSELITPGSLRASVLDAAKWGISLTRWDVTITGANSIELRAQVKPGLFRSGTPRAIRASVFEPIRATVQRAAGEELVTFVLPYDL